MTTPHVRSTPTRPRIDPSSLLEPDAGFAASDRKSHRQTARPIRLLADAIGPPRGWRKKIKSTRQSARLLVDFPEFQRRLERLYSKGLIDAIPSRLQLFFGCLDMVRYYIAPGAADYYESRGINFAFHNLLKLLDDPASILDPSGVRTTRDAIIGHVLHVVHANPIYDFQLLEMFEDGMDEMERQTRQIVDGEHPRQRSISAVVEDPDYHRRLLDYIRAYRQDPATPMLHRRAGSARDDLNFVLCEAQFGTLDGAFRYFCRLPRTIRELREHRRQHTTINPVYCDPDVVEALVQSADARLTPPTGAG